MRRCLLLLIALFMLALPVFKTAYVEAMTQQDIDSVINEETFYEPELIACSAAGSSTGGAANLEIGVDFSLGSDPVERRVNLIKALIADFELTPAQAAGPVGNFMWESGGSDLPPYINQGHSGEGPQAPAFSGGYGWAQWTGGRQHSFIDFAIENGYMASDDVPATDAASYAYLKKELTESYTATIEELKLQTTPEDAAVSFEDTFERAGVPALEGRKAGARQAYDEFMQTAGNPNVTPDATTDACLHGGAATIVGRHAFPLAPTKSVVNNPGMFRNGTADLGGHPYTSYDILADTGVEVVAFLSGTVTRITEDRCPGRMVSVYNEQEDLTISYLHMSYQNHVGMGDTVDVGQHIGFVGTLANGCVIPHLHIDAASGHSRPGCSRLNCPSANATRFVDIGAALFETFQALPD